MKIIHLLTLSIILSFSLPSSSLTNTVTFPISFAHRPQATTTTRTRLPVALVKIGTPPKTFRLLLDTGSDITWFFCDTDNPDSDTLSVMYANDFDDTVLYYTANYPDGMWATGDWVTETVTATSHDGSDVTIERVRIGCTDRSLSRIKIPIDGVLSLSRDSLSFAAQLAERFGDRFSYTLHEEGQLVIGARDTHASHYTQLSDSNSSSFYEAKVSSLSMGDTDAGVMKKIWDLHSQVLFDTGVTTTYFPRSAFRAIARYLADYFGDDVFFEVTDDKICFDPYYNSTSSSENEEEEEEEEKGIRLPDLSIEFEGNAKFVPKVDSLYYLNEEAAICVNVRPIDDDEPFLIGSTFQEGFTWDYDLSYPELGFTPDLD